MPVGEKIGRNYLKRAKLVVKIFSIAASLCKDFQCSNSINIKSKSYGMVYSYETCINLRGSGPLFILKALAILTAMYVIHTGRIGFVAVTCKPQILVA